MDIFYVHSLLIKLTYITVLNLRYYIMKFLVSVYFIVKNIPKFMKLYYIPGVHKVIVIIQIGTLI